MLFKELHGLLRVSSPDEPTQRIATTYRLKLVQLHIRFVSRLVRASLPENFLEPREHGGLVQLVAVELESFYELLHGPFRFERQK